MTATKKGLFIIENEEKNCTNLIPSIKKLSVRDLIVTRFSYNRKLKMRRKTSKYFFFHWLFKILNTLNSFSGLYH